MTMPQGRQPSRPRNRPRRGQPPASDPEPVDPLRCREVDRRMRRMPTVRFGRETSLLVLELRQEGGRGIHINMEGRGDQSKFELGVTFDLPPFSPTDPEAAEQLAAAIADQPPGALLLALPREESVLRRLSSQPLNPTNCPRLRFRLLQEAQLDEAGAAVDCLPIQTHEATTTAIVVGANGTIMAFGNALATASGRKLAGVSLRVLGLPDLLDTPGSSANSCH